MIISINSDVAHVMIYKSLEYPKIKSLNINNLSCVLDDLFFVKRSIKIKGIFKKFNLEESLLWDNVEDKILSESNGTIINAIENIDVATEILNEEDDYLILKIDYKSISNKKIKIMPNNRINAISYDFDFLTDGIIDDSFFREISFGNLKFSASDYDNHINELSDNSDVKSQLIVMKYNQENMIYEIENTLMEYN